MFESQEQPQFIYFLPISADFEDGDDHVVPRTNMAAVSSVNLCADVKFE